MTTPPYAGRSTPSLDLLGGIAEALGPLVDRVVFIGGAIAPLLQTHPISPRVRPTKDVDGVALTGTYSEFDALQADLRQRGFRQLAQDADATGHAHRWTTPAGGLFDLVPAGTYLGGSGNPLDQAAVDTAVSIMLTGPRGTAIIIRHADAPTFGALKWAAFEDRGGGDLFASHDIEDILAVVASRSSLPEECVQAPSLVRTAVSQMAGTLLKDEDAVSELLHAHVVVSRGHDAMAVHRQVHERLRRLVVPA